MSLTFIDKSKELNDIKGRYGFDWRFKTEAHDTAAALWGVNCNEHGVITDYKPEILAQKGTCKAIFKSVITSHGYCLIGLSATSSYSGFGYAPSVWDQYAFHSYRDARLFAIDTFQDYFHHIAHAKDGCNSDANRKNAKSTIALLHEQRTPQMALF